MNYNYLFSLFLNNLIFHVMTVSCGWVAYSLTGNPLSLAMVGLVQFLPAMLLFIVSGSASDYFDKRKIVSLVSGLSAVLIFALAWTVETGVRTDVYLIYAVLFAHSCCRSFEATAMASMVLEVVGESSLQKTVALGSSVKQVAKVTGPILAGYLLLWEDSGRVVFLTTACLAVLSCLSIISTSFGFPLKRDLENQKTQVGYRAIFSGFQTIRQSPVLLGALSLDLIAGLFGGLLGLLPLLVADVLAGDASMLGWLRSTAAIGSLIMSFSLVKISFNRRLGERLLLSVLALGVLMGLASLTTNPYLFGVILFLFGLLDSLSVHIRQNLIQLAACSSNRGRVTAASQFFVVVSNQLSEVRAGLMVSATGIVATVLLGGVAVSACALSWSRLFPALANLNSFEDFLPYQRPKKTEL